MRKYGDLQTLLFQGKDTEGRDADLYLTEMAVGEDLYYPEYHTVGGKAYFSY